MAWQSKIFSFNKEFSKGLKGEDIFIQCYKDKNARKSDTRDYDLLIKKDTKIELKTDYRSMESTPNIFIERWSDMDAKKPGGPYQSYEKGVFIFIYFFIIDMTFIWFKTLDLKNFIDKNKNTLYSRKIRNMNYNGFGYLVPRDKIQDIIIKEDKF